MSQKKVKSCSVAGNEADFKWGLGSGFKTIHFFKTRDGFPKGDHLQAQRSRICVRGSLVKELLQ